MIQFSITFVIFLAVNYFVYKFGKREGRDIATDAYARKLGNIVEHFNKEKVKTALELKRLQEENYELLKELADVCGYSEEVEDEKLPF